MINYILFIVSLIITILVEFLIYRKWLGKETPNLLKYVLLINLFTFPIATIIFGIYLNYFAIEFFIFLIESILIWLLFGVKIWNAFCLSFIANLVTTLIGWFLPL